MFLSIIVLSRYKAVVRFTVFEKYLESRKLFFSSGDAWIFNETDVELLIRTSRGGPLRGKKLK